MVLESMHTSDSVSVDSGIPMMEASSDSMDLEDTDRSLLEHSSNPLGEAPKPDFSGPVKYTVSFETKIDQVQGGWTNIFVRGSSQADRTPGAWTWPSSSRVHFRHQSLHDGNTDLDASTPCPIGKWCALKWVVNENRAWVYVNGKMDRYIELAKGNRFVWGQKSLGFSAGSHNTRNFVWSNEPEAEPSAALVPQPNFDAPVEYTLRFDAYIPSIRTGGWNNFLNRGASNSDRTPGLWTYPGSSRMHFRHASTQSSNHDIDTASNAPVGEWFTFKGVIKHNKAWVYLNGRLDRFVDLGPNHKFLWGQKSRGLAFGSAVHPSYGQIVIRNLKWRNSAKAIPVPQPDFSAPVQYTLSVDIKNDKPLPQWGSVVNRGVSNSDRTPGIWTWPGSNRIYFGHASTRSIWDAFYSRNSPPMGEWFNFKAVVNNNKAWTFVNGKLDQFIDLGPNHKFIWGTKNLGFNQGPNVHPSYANTQTKNFKWSNTVEMPYPAMLPQPNFAAPVQYTVSMQAFIPQIIGSWSNIFSRGASDGDRTPAMWTWPGSSRLHFRHGSNHNWNNGLDSRRACPVGKWFEIKVVATSRTLKMYIDGELDNEITLYRSDQFNWGSKNLGFRRQLSSGYSGHVRIRAFKWESPHQPAYIAGSSPLNSTSAIQLWDNTKKPDDMDPPAALPPLAPVPKKMAGGLKGPKKPQSLRPKKPVAAPNAKKGWKKRLKAAGVKVDDFSSSKKKKGYAGLEAVTLRKCDVNQKSQTFKFARKGRLTKNAKAAKKAKAAAVENKKPFNVAAGGDGKFMSFKLKGKDSSSVLTVFGRALGNGAHAGAYKFFGGDNQKFSVHPDGYIYWKHSKKGELRCLGAGVKRVGSKIRSYKCKADDPRQIWSINPSTGAIKNVAAERCATAAKDARDKMFGGVFTLTACDHKSPQQQFKRTDKVKVDEKAKVQSSLKSWSAFDGCKKKKADASKNGGSSAWTFGSTSGPTSTQMTPFSKVSTNQLWGMYNWHKPGQYVADVGCSVRDTDTRWGIFIPGSYWVHMHPGYRGERAALKWTSPVDTKVRLSTGFRGWHYWAFLGPTSDVHVLHNGKEIFSAFIERTWAETKFNKELEVKKGDTIEVQVGYGRNKNYYYDSTYARMTIKRLTA